MEIQNKRNNYVLVQYLSNINNIIKQTFQSMQRIKLTCFDASPNFLVFGATSGGIYIFRRDPCEFLKIIPSKEGSANAIAISNDEKHLGIASSKGLLLILENFIDDPNVQYDVYNEHEGCTITYMKWHEAELYVGNNFGKISVVSVAKALTKAIFQIPSESLMTLDSSIVQIDTYQNYLLASTKTRTYLCNTEKEHYIQIGTKSRDGHFGACFCNVAEPGSIDKNSVTIENEAGITINNTHVKIYCARPGARLWEVNLEAKVLVTFQFKATLKENPTELLVIGCDSESTFQKHKSYGNEKVPDKFNFQKIYPIFDRFILTFDLNRLYIFDPIMNKLVFWTYFSSNIKAVAVINNMFFIWKVNLEISVLALVELEYLIMSTLYKSQYYLCAEICIEYYEEVLRLLEFSQKLYLINILKEKLNSTQLLEQLRPILDKVKEVNAKIFTKRGKNNLVRVDNLYLLDIEEPKVVQQNLEKVDENEDLKSLFKQYTVNKTHSTIEIPEVKNILEQLNGEDLFLLYKRFMEYTCKEINEDSTEWCQDQYIKQIYKKNIVVKDLKEDCFNFLLSSFFKGNETIKFSCSCGHPLPTCHRYPPNFYKTGLDILYTKKNTHLVLKEVPYLSRYRIKSEIDGLNLPLLVQFSDLRLLIEYSKELKYDNWHDLLSYFNKINKGMCLNCDNKINIKDLLTWTDLAMVMVQSIGARNALRILKSHQKSIPNGALNPRFYQSCVLAHTFNNVEVDLTVPFNLFDGLDGASYYQFQEYLEKYFKRKYNAVGESSNLFVSDNFGTCFMCNLPLKNDILFEHENPKNCDHKFHKLCLNKNKGICSICCI